MEIQTRRRTQPALAAQRRAAVFALAAIAAACDPVVPAILDPPAVPPSVVVDLREATYPVRGRTVQAIETSLAANAPTWGGERVWGLVQWRARWRWRGTHHGPSCQLTDVRVYITVEIALPEWRDHAGAPPELRIRWEDFEVALRGHEYGHRDRAFLAAGEIHDALLALRADDCLALAALADVRAREVLQRHVDLDEDYEQRTQRGRAQGAVWPPG